MKIIYYLLIPLFLISCGNSKQIFLDERGKKMTHTDFQERWRNMDNNLFRWDHINADGSREAKLFSSVYSVYQINYSLFIKSIENLTNKKFPKNQIFILDYTYVNDLCSVNSSNRWDKKSIKMRKEFTDLRKEEIEQTPNMMVLNFFEEGINLENSEHSPAEYYFMDKGNFLRNRLFKKPSLCGSLAIVKPNGQVLVRNGEYSILSMTQHLKPENWDQFFPPSE